jgi:hypothetical protein
MKYLSTRKQMLRCIVVGCALLPVAAIGAGVEFPQEAGGYKKSDLPGYQIANGLCLMCHSSQYVSSQPPKSSPKYWNATIHKMKDVYKAPLQDDMIPAVVEYLSVEYGGQDRAAAHADYEKAMAALKNPATADTSKK